MPATCSIARALRRLRAGWCGCWRERLPIRSVRSAGSTFWALTSVTPSCGSGTRPRARCRVRRCPSCSRRRLRTPEADAVVFEDERLSYGELDARSSRLAHHLRALGVGPEVVVGLCIERSLAMLVGLVGILKAGGAYLPLDPDYPPERLAFMLADAGAPVLLTRSALRAHLPAHDAHVVCLDADWPAIASQPATAPATNLAPQHPAYVIYTSGSTGTPKGVAVTHGGIPNLAAVQIDRFAITSQARVLQF